MNSARAGGGGAAAPTRAKGPELHPVTAGGDRFAALSRAATRRTASTRRICAGSRSRATLWGRSGKGAGVWLEAGAAFLAGEFRHGYPKSPFRENLFSHRVAVRSADVTSCWPGQPALVGTRAHDGMVRNSREVGKRARPWRGFSGLTLFSHPTCKVEFLSPAGTHLF